MNRDMHRMENSFYKKRIYSKILTKKLKIHLSNLMKFINCCINWLCLFRLLLTFWLNLYIITFLKIIILFWCISSFRNSFNSRWLIYWGKIVTRFPIIVRIPTFTSTPRGIRIPIITRVPIVTIFPIITRVPIGSCWLLKCLSSMFLKIKLIFKHKL